MVAQADWQLTAQCGNQEGILEEDINNFDGAGRWEIGYHG